MKNLVIVESPAKARTIERFLGDNFQVLSSFGHVRDLSKHNLGIDIEHMFEPDYVVSEGKEKVVKDLRAAVSRCDQVWLASDEDREGEAIAWHLAVVLGLSPETTHRIVFHEITREAIQHAITNPRTIDQRLVDAQQARRILDRLVGFEVSPILWRRVKPSLSAGRVQSVAVRLLVEREREINAYQAQRFYRVTAYFAVGKAHFRAELSRRLETQEEARAFLMRCDGFPFRVLSVEERPGSRTPAPPFTTSTLQQEASRKLGFSAQRTMSVAQRLYESGMITYMRTDSVNLSSQALANLGSVVEHEYGAEYHKVRQYRTKSKGAQEAHEAIRPTDAQREKVGGESDDERLYELIRKRALASQMADARLMRTTVEVSGPSADSHFVAQGEVIQFDGFLRLYLEGNDDETQEQGNEHLPRLAEGEFVDLVSVLAQERYTQRPARYSEASLVKRLEELGIGRPSTYAPTIATIVDRGYVQRDSRDGEQRTVWQMELKGGTPRESTVQESYGADRKKLFPSDIGMVVTDYLMAHFPRMMEYNFTASVEEQFDSIAEGKLGWREMLSGFYTPFHQKVDEALTADEGHVAGERILGTDPASGHTVLVRIGRFGPLAQIGTADEVEKPRYASLRKGQLLERITLEEALQLFALPREIGSYEGKPLVVGAGRFGPYVLHDGKYTSLGRGDDPYTIESARAIELIEEKRKRDAERLLHTYPEDEGLTVIRGRWGAYLSYGGKSYRIPKGVSWETLSYADAMRLVEEQQAAGRSTAAKGKKTTARTTAKSASSKAKPTSRKGASRKGKKTEGE